MPTPRRSLPQLVSLCLCAAAGAQEPSAAPAPPEFGAIHFGRDFAKARAAAKAATLPTLLLFQEVPG